MVNLSIERMTTGLYDSGLIGSLKHENGNCSEKIPTRDYKQIKKEVLWGTESLRAKYPEIFI